jgi:AcrR family transcriptional regulator
VNAFIKPPANRAKRPKAVPSTRDAADPPLGRQQLKAATRARVLDAAKSQLESLGFEQTSIRGVAKAAGVATGTVLLHFPDKRDLLHAAVFDDLERTWAKAKRAPRKQPLRRALACLVQAFFDYYARRPALSRTLLRESLFAEPPWSARFAAQVADVHRHVVELTNDAKSRGELDASVESEVLGAAFFSFYYFALLAWLQGGHPAPQRLFERMLDQHLERSTPSPPRPRKGTKT